jgi:hypothetical protein
VAVFGLEASEVASATLPVSERRHGDSNESEKMPPKNEF